MKDKIRYAVVGLGHIAQAAVLPAFKNAKTNSELTALVSGDPQKLKKLGAKYGVACYSYSEYEDCLESGNVDAVYICTPNSYHQRFAEIAAQHKIHVLCEKPMALTEQACLSMIEAARENQIKLMVAYRLHFEAANLHAIELARSRKLGDLKVFNSVFTMQVRDRSNIRLNRELGGGPLYDIGIYCINACRYLFRDEPIEAMALASTKREDSRFHEVDECVSAILRFTDDRTATFVCSFGAADSAAYDLIGSSGRIHIENAYEYATPMELTTFKDERKTKKTFAKRDQFAPELIYFSDCVIHDREPEPSGMEGLADVRVIQALNHSIDIGQAINIPQYRKETRPTRRQEITRPAINPPRPVHAVSPSGGAH